MTGHPGPCSVGAMTDALAVARARMHATAVAEATDDYDIEEAYDGSDEAYETMRDQRDEDTEEL